MPKQKGEIMKVWVGHYRGNTKEWFVVWAKNKREAFLQIDPITGEPDMESLKELHAPGFVDFKADFEGETEFENMQFSPSLMCFGGALGQSDDVEEYVFKIIRKKKKQK